MEEQDWELVFIRPSSCAVVMLIAKVYDYAPLTMLKGGSLQW